MRFITLDANAVLAMIAREPGSDMVAEIYRDATQGHII